MTLMDIGRVCVKLAGRESGKICVIVDFDKKNKNFVVIDGNVRRKTCNVKHLEPLNSILKIKKGASTSEIHSLMKKEKIDVFERKKKESQKKEKPKRLKVVKNKNKVVKEVPKSVKKKGSEKKSKK